MNRDLLHYFWAILCVRNIILVENKALTGSLIYKHNKWLVSHYHSNKGRDAATQVSSQHAVLRNNYVFEDGDINRKITRKERYLNGFTRNKLHERPPFNTSFVKEIIKILKNRRKARSRRDISETEKTELNPSAKFVTDYADSSSIEKYVTNASQDISPETISNNVNGAQRDYLINNQYIGPNKKTSEDMSDSSEIFPKIFGSSTNAKVSNSGAKTKIVSLLQSLRSTSQPPATVIHSYIPRPVFPFKKNPLPKQVR